MLLICINFAPEVSGIAPYTASLATSLSNFSDEVVVTTMPHYPEWSKKSASKTEVIKSKAGYELTVKRAWHFVPKNMNFAGRLLLESSFAFSALTTKWGGDGPVIVVSPSLITSVASLLKAKFTRREARRLLWIQDLYTAGLIQKYGSSSPVTKFFKSLERQAVKLSDMVVVIHPRFSSFVRDELNAESGKVAVVRNWSHFNSAPDESPSAVRAKYGLSEARVLVCHTGNMGFKQGLGNVIEAARLSSESENPVEFLLVGNGNQRKSLEAQGQGLENIHFVDSVSDGELANLMSASDVLLINELSGMREMALPSKFTTYLTAGKPILLASDAESIMAEELELSGAGIRVDADNPSALLEGIKEIATSHQRDEFVANGKAHLEKYLTPEAAFAAFREILQLG
jgi:colanic acid biosynthesis glycosyl transferase WcaI